MANTLVPYSTVSSVSSFALRYGLNPSRLFEQAGLDLAHIQFHQTPLSIEAVQTLNELIQRQANLPHYGLLMGQHLQAEMLGLFGPLIASSPTLRLAVGYFSEFKDLLHPRYDLDIEPFQDGNKRVVYQSRHEQAIGDEPVYAETLFSALVNLGNVFIGANTPLDDGQMGVKAVYFRHAKPSYWQEYERVFQCPIYFEHDRDELIVPTELLDTSLLSHSYVIHQTLKSQADQALPKRDADLSAYVRQLMRQHGASPAQAPLSADQVAEHLHISRRTLHRRLSQEGTSFREIKDALFLDSAKRLLLNTSLSTEAIAVDLGFQDRSNFVHAFKRLTGTSPSAFRKPDRE